MIMSDLWDQIADIADLNKVSRYNNHSKYLHTPKQEQGNLIIISFLEQRMEQLQ